MELDMLRGGVDLGGDGREETMISIYFMNFQYKILNVNISNKKRKKERSRKKTHFNNSLISFPILLPWKWILSKPPTVGFFNFSLFHENMDHMEFSDF